MNRGNVSSTVSKKKREITNGNDNSDLPPQKGSRPKATSAEGFPAPTLGY